MMDDGHILTYVKISTIKVHVKISLYLIPPTYGHSIVTDKEHMCERYKDGCTRGKGPNWQRP